MEEKRNRFHKSKIYKLVCQTPFYYIGATTNSLSKRLSEHKRKARKYPERKAYSYFNEIGWENVKIILIEEMKIENIEQLRRIEDDSVRVCLSDTFCLNSNRVVLSAEEIALLRKKSDFERYWKNHEKELQRGNEYYRNNNEKIRCACGSEVVKPQLKRHEKTRKHIQYLETLATK